MIVGGGAAGFFCGISAAERARAMKIPYQIDIFESSPQFLKKVKISGGGRCNVTHNCFDVRTFTGNYPRGQRELLSPMQRFQAKDMVEWLAEHGVKTKAETDGRMFPVTDKSQTIINCFFNRAKELGINLHLSTAVTNIKSQSDNSFEITLKGQSKPLTASYILIATGSSPAGYRFAENLGHSITDRAPSLFTFKISDPLIKDLMGISFPNTSLKLNPASKGKFTFAGPTLITHWGLSGPAILKLSAWAAREMKASNYEAKLTVNWTGAQSQKEIEQELTTLAKTQPKSFLKNQIPLAIPKRFWHQLLDVTQINLDTPWGQLSKKALTKISETLYASRLQIKGQSRFKDEFVECGGINLKEIDFKSMESKYHKGLYFAGELLDIDGITGGFNFQNAWTTGWVAAQHMIES